MKNVFFNLTLRCARFIIFREEKEKKKSVYIWRLFFIYIAFIFRVIIRKRFFAKVRAKLIAHFIRVVKNSTNNTKKKKKKPIAKHNRIGAYLY